MLQELKQWWKYNNFWDSPEVSFQLKLKENPIYPFTEEDEAFVMDISNTKLCKGFVFLFVGFFGEILYWSQQQQLSNDLFDTIFILLILYSTRLIYINRDKRKIEISKDCDQYNFYIGQKVAHKGQIHNIYLRLRSQRSSNGNTYYRVCLNGYHVEEQYLTSLTTNKAVLEKMAIALANRLNINYFDSDDVSYLHVVRHMNPYKFYRRPTKFQQSERSRMKRMSVTRATLEAFY